MRPKKIEINFFFINPSTKLFHLTCKFPFLDIDKKVKNRWCFAKGKFQ
jgi:hypothetical protein